MLRSINAEAGESGLNGNSLVITLGQRKVRTPTATAGEKCYFPRPNQGRLGPLGRWMDMRRKVETILIFRLGSLGDTVVALPSLHLIERRYPGARRVILSEQLTSSKAAALRLVLENSGLVDDYMDYPVQNRGIGDIVHLHRRIRALRPDVLIYLVEAQRPQRIWRDYLFFRSCGIPRLIGFPFDASLRRHAALEPDTLWESEASRLARCLAVLGAARVHDAASWDLRLTAAERQQASALLDAWAGRGRFIALSLGTKSPANDWGAQNWRSALDVICRRHPGVGLLLIGAASETELSSEVAATWSGDVLNLCGRSPPRVSAAVLAGARAFLGHDSGPMHLAAAVGTPCVAVFSGRNPPGEWFPTGSQHRIIYHRTDCFGCRLHVCEVQQKKCILSIGIAEVADAVDAVLGAAA